MVASLFAVLTCAASFIYSATTKRIMRTVGLNLEPASPKNTEAGRFDSIETLRVCMDAGTGNRARVDD
jgi:hypothetical protein